MTTNTNRLIGSGMMVGFSDFDVPIFKLIPKNESSIAKGKQSGFVIPNQYRGYFPKLAAPGPANWIPDTQIRALLVIDDVVVDDVSTRYQNQTWNGTRIPGEYRITGDLGPLIRNSMPADLLLIRRHIQQEDFYILELTRQGTAAFDKLKAVIGGRHSGPIHPTSPPVMLTDVADAEKQQASHEKKALELFDNDASMSETRVKRIARSRAFSKRLSALYGNKCCVCGAAMKSPAGHYETQGAHVVSRNLKGADDARNGLLLCRSHHWAFDEGMFGLTANRIIYLRKDVAKDPANAALVAFDGKPIAAPSDPLMLADEEALAWHRREVVREEP